jgi:hypothetical protein
MKEYYAKLKNLKRLLSAYYPIFLLIIDSNRPGNAADDTFPWATLRLQHYVQAMLQPVTAMLLPVIDLRAGTVEKAREIVGFSTANEQTTLPDMAGFQVPLKISMRAKSLASALHCQASIDLEMATRMV